MRDLVTPVEGLAIEIGQGGEGTGGEEVVPNILDGAFHAAFFIAAGRSAGSSGKVVVSGEFQEAGVEVNGIAAALQDHAAEIVGLEVTGRSTPILKGVDVAEEEILQTLVEEELDPQGAAVGESEDEAGQTATGTAQSDFPEVGPISLCLLAGEGAQAQKSFPLGRAQFGHDAAELIDAAGIAAQTDHLVEAGSTQARILLQGLAQEVEVRIGEAVAQPRLAAEAIGVERGAHRIRMQVQFCRNGAHFPMLGVKQVTDLSDLFIGNHASPREKDSPSVPGARRSDRRPHSLCIRPPT